MSSPSTIEPTTTKMPDCCADASLATTFTATTTTTAIAASTRGEETPPPPLLPPPPGEQYKSRYFLRHRQGHTFSALQVKKHRDRNASLSIVASLATTAAAVASVAACSNQTPASSAAAVLLPTHVTPSSVLKMTPISPSTSSSLRFASFAATETTPSQDDEEQPSQLPRSKRMAANHVVVVTPEPSSSSSKHRRLEMTSQKDDEIANQTPQKKQPKSAVAVASWLPLPSSLRTESFQALTPNRFPSLQGKHIIPHTLILGTHPSITSLQHDQYYGHVQNAFWWIAGDCLGFRRGTGISESTGKPFALTAALRHGPDKIISYTQQTERLMQAGFLLWDVVASCERTKIDSSSYSSSSSSRSTNSKKKKGAKKVMLSSLDQDIKNEVPNDIRSFCAHEYPTIKRIVFANGQTGSSLFCRHNKEWLASGELFAGADELSQRYFSKACCGGSSSSGGVGKKQENDTNVEASPSSSSISLQDGKGKIELIAAISVSPAAARLSFAQKRDWWAKNVYEPGLRDHKDLLLHSAKA